MPVGQSLELAATLEDIETLKRVSLALSGVNPDDDLKDVPANGVREGTSYACGRVGLLPLLSARYLYPLSRSCFIFISPLERCVFVGSLRVFPDDLHRLPCLSSLSYSTTGFARIISEPL